jgi:signal transduction histidine kinase/DNA-binding response OmpR family regulator
MKLQTDEILSQQTEIERHQNRIDEYLKIYRNQRIALYSLVGSLTLAIIFGAYVIYALKEKRNANRILERKNLQINEQKEEIQRIALEAEDATKAKFRFFTNISHEFRTPLSLIMGPLDMLLEDKVLKTRKNALQHLLLIKNNAERLLRLINQLMAFRKIENNKLKLQVSKQNIVEFINDIKKGFDTLAIKKNIDFQLQYQDSSIEVWFDRNWLDKVIFNLLSNAFKFTDQNGLIHMQIAKDNQKGIVTLRVEDNGRGMSQEHVRYAFDRFYTGDNFSDKGTGLGLSLSKELIELHGGNIELQSEKGYGTVFIVNLPLGSTHFSESNLVSETKQEETVIDHTWEIDDLMGEEVKLDQKRSEKDFTILIIEDNEELNSFLSSSLSTKYKVVSCMDGEMGLKRVIEEIPDLVICDITLPGKDGLTITKNIKSDYRTSHIPVILLTARTHEDQKLEGLRSGADAYITKPFQFEFLLENIKNLFRNRESLKLHFSEDAFEMIEDESIDLKRSNPDDEFIKKFKLIVKQNLNNHTFGVQDICNEMGFSRVQLYRKVKVLLDYSVNDYINAVRMKKAIKLLRKTDSSISDIAYTVGFSSPAYFSTAFKSYFKISPSDARKS